jgi:hypothetical protein
VMSVLVSLQITNKKTKDKRFPFKSTPAYLWNPMCSLRG